MAFLVLLAGYGFWQTGRSSDQDIPGWVIILGLLLLPILLVGLLLVGIWVLSKNTSISFSPRIPNSTKDPLTFGYMNTSFLDAEKKRISTSRK